MKSFLLILFLACLQLVYSQTTYTFVSELEFEVPEKNIQAESFNLLKEISHVPIEYINKNEIILKGVLFEKIPIKKREGAAHIKIPHIINIDLVQKEIYWNNGEYRWTEARIIIPKDLYSKVEHTIQIQRVNKNGSFKEWLMPNKSLSVEIPDNSNNILYINENTFKTNWSINIHSPEELGLSIVLDYLNKSFDSTITGFYSFKSTIQNLNYYHFIDSSIIKKNNDLQLSKSLDSSFVTFDKFKEFSGLLLFIEPYLDSNSFFNHEADKLNDSIKGISTMLDSSKGNNNNTEYLRNRLLEFDSIYLAYQMMKQRILKYHIYLQEVLFDKRYNCFAENKSDSMIKIVLSDTSTSMKPSFVLGLTFIPAKARLGNNFDFQSTLSLGLSTGINFSLSKYNSNSLNLLFDVSLSTVSIDSASVNSGPPLSNVAVFSPSFGIAFGIKKFCLGIFYGWDYLNQKIQSRYNWIYNKKSWLSLGFSINLFTYDRKANLKKVIDWIENKRLSV